MEISFTWESRSCMGATWESHHVHMGIRFTWESRSNESLFHMGITLMYGNHMGITSRSYGNHVHMGITFTWEFNSYGNHVHMGISFIWESHGNHITLMYMGTYLLEVTYMYQNRATAGPMYAYVHLYICTARMYVHIICMARVCMCDVCMCTCMLHPALH